LSVRILSSKKNLRLLVTGGLPDPLAPGLTFRSVAGGFLAQTRDNGRTDKASLKIVTKKQPTQQQWLDIAAGYEICRKISQMDIGQCIAVIDRDVIAVEALEGTNLMIERAGKLCPKGGWTLIKVSNTYQDMRVDVPSIGTTTIEKLHAAKCVCVVLDAGKTIMLERPKVIELADRYKMAVVGIDESMIEKFPKL